jgi:hypothetical protein
LTAAARVGLGNPRSGQKKACGAVEQKKAAKQGRKKRRKKRLLLWPRLENEETAPRSNQETDHKEPERRRAGATLTHTTAPGRPPLPNRLGLSPPKRTNDVLPKPDILISYRQEFVALSSRTITLRELPLR